MARDLDSMWQTEQRDFIPRDFIPRDLARLRRTFMAGALAALDLQRGGATREVLMAELVAYGRSVGTCVETAR